MSKPFFITGLPRSRTAWLALAATTDRSICFHEPLARMQEWQDVSHLWANDVYEFVAVSDSGLGFHIDHILETSAPRTLIVERPVGEVTASLRAIGIDNPSYCKALAEYIERVRPHPLVRYVGFSDLADIKVVAECLRWLMPGLGVDMNKLEELSRLNVQADMGLVWKQVEARKKDFAPLAGVEVANYLKTLPVGA